jgi:4-aminobutyrate aminotransferase-like enzyme
MTDPLTAPRGKMNNAFDPSRTDGLDPATRDLVARRQRLLGPAYRLFYDNPVELTCGSGVLLYDRAGNEYLDAYNNVVPVGHAHPRVVDAVSGQLATLCTHTRYLQEGILRYAADLLPTFGGRIAESGHAMFTCTGSEANDLALRIAKYHTGQRGIIVTAEAYHGNSDLTASLSPSLGDQSHLGTWVRQVPAPDSYRISPGTMAQLFADNVASQIRDLERHGSGVAALIVDSLFSSDGIFALPTDILGPAAEVVRRAGGLFIADEVQSGFGRTGEALWGYQRHGVDPDIVTMGKPMGSGYPVAAVAVVPEVVERFGHDIRYFNTFGGNTVAIAAAQATLDVIRDDGLVHNADVVGKFLRDGLRELAARHVAIGDVRGAGLYIGIELVKDRDIKEPDPASASAVVNQMRERRVLISITGCHANTLKIRPPLVFSNADASRLLAELDAVLQTAARHADA